MAHWSDDMLIDPVVAGTVLFGVFMAAILAMAI